MCSKAGLPQESAGRVVGHFFFGRSSLSFGISTKHSINTQEIRKWRDVLVCLRKFEKKGILDALLSSMDI